MRMTRIWALCSLLVLPVAAEAKTTVRHVPLSPSIGPFPSDVLTVADPLQKTGRHVNLSAVSDAEIACLGSDVVSCAAVKGLLNQFDGFSVKPQFNICFSGPVDPSSLKGGIAVAPADGSAGAMAVNQVFYDRTTNCVQAKPDNVLNQGTRYLLFVSNRVRAADGTTIVADDAFKSCALGGGTPYCAALKKALTSGPREARSVSIAGASIFTTIAFRLRAGDVPFDYHGRAATWLYDALREASQGKSAEIEVYNVHEVASARRRIVIAAIH